MIEGPLWNLIDMIVAFAWRFEFVLLNMAVVMVVVLIAMVVEKRGAYVEAEPSRNLAEPCMSV